MRSLAGQYNFVFNKKLYTEDGEVTPTMKVKYKAIAERYKDIIEEMYKACAAQKSPVYAGTGIDSVQSCYDCFL